MIWIYLTACCYYAIQTNSYVLLAANIDDVAKIAKKFVTEQLTDEYETEKSINEDSGNSDKTQTTNPNNDGSEEAYSESSKRHFRGAHNTENKKPETATVFEMNLDDLVERVKEKLKDELTQIVASDQNAPDAVIQVPAKYENSDEYDNKYESNDETTKLQSKYLQKPRNDKNKQLSMDESINYVTESRQPKGLHISRTTTERTTNKMKRKPRKKKIQGENHNPFQGISLTNGNDSYDDYIIPNKDDEYEETEPSYTRKGKNMPTEATVQAEEETDEESYVKQRKKKTRESPAILPLKMSTDPETGDFIQEENVNPLLTYAEQIVGSEPPVEEYEDETTTISIDKIGARTQSILFQEEPSFEKIIVVEKPINQAKGKKYKTPTRNTGIPKRDFYKLSSPNYLEKLPKVVEKYKFDEPLPEKDREPELLRNIGNPPASINGKEMLL